MAVQPEIESGGLVTAMATPNWTKLAHRLDQVKDLVARDALSALRQIEDACRLGLPANLLARCDHLRIQALVALHRIGQARTLSADFFRRHPDAETAIPQIIDLTGMRPRPFAVSFAPGREVSQYAG